MEGAEGEGKRRETRRKKEGQREIGNPKTDIRY
jgi:hypothetical protein